MNILVPTMSIKTTSPLDKFADSFFGRLVIAALSVVVATLGIPFLFLTNSLLPPAILRWSALAWLGLAAGAAARGLLHAFPTLLRLLSALAILVGGLLLCDRLTSGYIGLHASFYSNPVFDWVGMLQFIVSALVVGLVLFAQRRPRVRVAPVKPPSTSAVPSRSKVHLSKKAKPVKVQSQSTLSSPVTPVIPRPNPWQPRLKNLGESLRIWRKRAGQAAAQSRQKAGALWKRSQQALRLNRKSSPVRFPVPRFNTPVKPAPTAVVHLVGEEEHRCPFCLELVDPNDSRGIWICPECHTYHHADCWAVTGACQVPHHHA